MAGKETVECRWTVCTSEGDIPQEEFKDCRIVSTESTGRYTSNLRSFLEARGLDGEAQWVVMADGSLVATQSIDHPLYEGQPGWGPNDEIPAATEDQIIAYMEQHEDDWDEVAFNGFGTAHIARMGNLTHGLAESGDFVGIQWPTSDDAKEAVKSTAAGWLEMSDEASHQILKEGEGS